MYEIDSTFFTGQINIPNSDEPRGLDINPWIEKGCYLFLSNLLGAKLYSELRANLDDDLNLKTDAADKWRDLFYGKTYDDKIFKGLVQKHKLFKSSVLANYTFWYWLKDNLEVVSGIGSVVLEGKNAINASSDNRAREVWNDIVLAVVDRSHGNDVRCRVSYIRGVRFEDFYGHNSNDGSVTISQFLQDHADEYPNPSLQAPLGYVYDIQNWLGI